MEILFKKKTSDRDSSIELLRIICMLFVIVHHFIIRGARVAVDNSIFEPTLSPDYILSVFLDPFVYCAVNVFVLISGYFGIKLKISNITNLYTRCAIYGLLCYLVHIYVDGGTLGRYYFLHECLFSLTNTRWFIGAYLALLLLSPILNASIQNIGRYQFNYFLLLLTIINVYFGWLGGAPVNPTGYNVMQFIYLYFLGRYLNIYHITIDKKYAIFVYVLCAILSGTLSFIFIDTRETTKWFFLFAEKYNSPILIVESVALLLLFRNFVFKNRIINWAASSVIAVYLIHTNPNIDESILYPLLSDNYFSIDTIFLRYLVLFCLSVGTLIGCLIIDKLLSFVIVPVSHLLEKIGNKIILAISNNLIFPAKRSQ